jgi:hypothetical protein
LDLEAYIPAVLRIILHAACGVLLVKNWLQGKKRFYSDFPFVLSLVFFTLAAAKAFDLGIFMVYTPADTSVAFLGWIRLRYVVMALNTIEMLAILLIIWFRARRGWSTSIFTVYSAAWGLMLLFAPTYEAISRSLLYFAVPVIISLILTFLFTYRQKRLVNKFNSLTVAIGTIIYAISQSIRAPLMSIGPGTWGLVWVSEIIDLAAWTIIFWGFFKPSVPILNQVKIENTLHVNP